MIEVRRWECGMCENKFWVDCDADEYPTSCPYCGHDIIKKDLKAKTETLKQEGA